MSRPEDSADDAGDPASRRDRDREHQAAEHDTKGLHDAGENRAVGEDLVQRKFDHAQTE